MTNETISQYTWIIFREGDEMKARPKNKFRPGTNNNGKYEFWNWKEFETFIPNNTFPAINLPEGEIEGSELEIIWRVKDKDEQDWTLLGRIYNNSTKEQLINDFGLAEQVIIPKKTISHHIPDTKQMVASQEAYEKATELYPIKEDPLLGPIGNENHRYKQKAKQLCFIRGSEWQAQQSYSQDEVETIIKQVLERAHELTIDLDGRIVGYIPDTPYKDLLK